MIEIKSGFPLSKFQYKTKHKVNKFVEQNEIVPTTNDYFPLSRDSTINWKRNSRNIRNGIQSLGILSKSFIRSLLKTDYQESVRLNAYDPIRGNILESVKYLTEKMELFIFATGYSLSQIVVLISECGQFDLSNATKVELPMNKIQIILQEELNYPVLQTTISSCSTLRKIIFAVRTSVAVHVFETSGEIVNKIHVFDIHNNSISDPELDYSVPCHVEMHPFSPYIYVFITGNNYVALIDASSNNILFDGIIDIPQDIDYSSIFRSCGFGKGRQTLLIATPQYVQKYRFKKSKTEVETIYIPSDRIFGFKSVLTAGFYLIATFENLEIIKYGSRQPSIKCRHGMQDSPPTHLYVEKILDSKWAFAAFSPYTQRVFYVELNFSEKSKDCIMTDVRHFCLKKSIVDENLYSPLHVPAYGLCIKQSKPLDKSRFFSFYRSFEDGSLKVDYIVVDHNPRQLSMNTRPSFKLFDGDLLEELNDHVKKIKTPLHNSSCRKDREIYQLNTAKLHTCLEGFIQNVVLLNDERRMHIVKSVKNLNNATLNELFYETKQSNFPSTEDLKIFMDQIKVSQRVEVKDAIKTSRLIDDPYFSENSEIKSRLARVYKEKYELSTSIVVRSVTPCTSQPQYLPSHVKVKSTTTSRVMSSLWKIDANSSNQIVFCFPDSTNTVATDIRFPEALDSLPFMNSRESVNIEENDESLLELPAIQSSMPTKKFKKAHMSAMTQPLLKSSKKKKKTKASGFK